jgi:hypothetical protein
VRCWWLRNLAETTCRSSPPAEKLLAILAGRNQFPESAGDPNGRLIFEPSRSCHDGASRQSDPADDAVPQVRLGCLGAMVAGVTSGDYGLDLNLLDGREWRATFYRLAASIQTLGTATRFRAESIFGGAEAGAGGAHVGRADGKALGSGSVAEWQHPGGDSASGLSSPVKGPVTQFDVL